MTANSIPNVAQPIAGTARVDPTWFRFFSELERRSRLIGVDLSAEIASLARKLGSPDGSIAGIPDAANGQLVGLSPIIVAGSNVSLEPVLQPLVGELLGIQFDEFGRVTGARPVVAGAGIAIDDTTDPEEIALINENPNVMTTLGDMVRGATAGAPQRLPIGTNGQVLTVVSGVPQWAPSIGSGAANTMALLHFDGANGSAVFRDDVFQNRWIAYRGTPTLSNAQARFGTTSLNCGTGNAVRNAVNQVWLSGVDDLTLEGWFYPTSTPTSAFRSLFGNWTGNNGVCVFQRTSNFAQIQWNASSAVSAAAVFANNTWQHVALVYTAGTATLYVGGAVAAALAVATPQVFFAEMAVGANGVASDIFQGFVDEFRASRIARYTAAFTPPSAPFAID